VIDYQGLKTIFTNIGKGLALVSGVFVTLSDLFKPKFQDSLGLKETHIVIIAICVVVAVAFLYYLQESKRIFSRASRATIIVCWIFLIVSGIVMVREIVQMISDSAPLPLVLKGKISYPKGDPVVDASLRIIMPDGTDITQGQYETDSNGDFLIKALTNPYREYDLLIICDENDGKKNIKLKLFQGLQSNGEFIHTIPDCDERK
jgi:uncharacterized membrane protein SirB2